jgi:hypothetical protein
MVQAQSDYRFAGKAMKRNLFITALIILILINGIAGQSPVLDCEERKEKILLLKKSIARLDVFKTGTGVVEGSDTTYSSSFELCGKKAVLIKKKYSIILKIEFSSEDYSSDIYVISNLKNKVLATLKDVFNGWKTDISKNEDEDGKSELNYFLDGADNTWEAKNYVLLNSYITSDTRIFSLEVESKR